MIKVMDRVLTETRAGQSLFDVEDADYSPGRRSRYAKPAPRRATEED